MSLREKYRKILTGLVPAGAVGVSVLLGSSAPSAASVGGQDPASAQPAISVAERLAAVRDAVSDVVEHRSGDHAGPQLAWGNWGNGGWGGGWERPWGWGNGGWRPWSNWRNGWNNWGNWWRNW
jgi:rSAM-associated Gly-rich repeat protein